MIKKIQIEKAYLQQILGEIQRKPIQVHAST